MRVFVDSYTAFPNKNLDSNISGLIPENCRLIHRHLTTRLPQLCRETVRHNSYNTHPSAIGRPHLLEHIVLHSIDVLVLLGHKNIPCPDSKSTNTFHNRSLVRLSSRN